MEAIRVKVVAVANSPNLAMRWIDPATGLERQRSARTANRKEAEKLAARLEADLQAGRFVETSRMTWEDFRTRYEKEELPNLAPRTAEPRASVMNHVEEILRPKRLTEITAEKLSHFQSQLREKKLAETTIAGHLAHLGAILRWAHDMGLLPVLPKIKRSKRARQGSAKRFMRGRPITTEEYERMLAAVPAVRPQDAPLWRFYLTGLWLSGLRLEESLRLSWDSSSGFSIDATGRRPQFRIRGDSQKSGKDELLPLVPEFWEHVRTVAAKDRQGRVFRIPLSRKRVCRVVAKIGEKAGVVVNKAAKKFASAHDLRRSFGTRWAPKVMPVVLQRLMRHSSIETTLRYYVELNADDLADGLWAGYLSGRETVAGQSGGSQAEISDAGDSLGDTSPQTDRMAT